MSVSIGYSGPRPQSRKGVWIAGLSAAAVAAVGLGVMALVRTPLPAPAPVDPASAMRIDVVAPTEPDIQPGARMEVGDLVDGYKHAPISTVASEMDAYDAAYQTAWIEPLPEPVPEREWSYRDDPPPPPVERVVAEGRNLYGFDAPGPDYGAERRARRERLDRLEQLESVPPSTPSGQAVTPRLRADTAFY